MQQPQRKQAERSSDQTECNQHADVAIHHAGTEQCRTNGVRELRRQRKSRADGICISTQGCHEDFSGGELVDAVSFKRVLRLAAAARDAGNVAR